MKVTRAPDLTVPLTRPVTLKASGEASVKPGVPYKLRSEGRHWPRVSVYKARVNEAEAVRMDSAAQH